MIKTLTKEYIQKSRIFLYPLLNIRRGSGATPLESYVSWNDIVLPEECKLICTYTLREDEDFKKFERTHLLGNTLFDSYYDLEDGTGAYVFTFSDYQDDWNHFMNGSYSNFKDKTKDKIVDFFTTSSTNKEHVMSYLYPERYYENYSNLLAVNVKVLKKVGQLCSQPDMYKENLTVKIKESELFGIF